MGTKTSREMDINRIATEYILGMNFQDMMNMQTEAGCNKTSSIVDNILQTQISDEEIKTIYDSDVFLFPENNDTKIDKNMMCKDIARFYVKIAHLFAAIITTVNPKYQYIDSEGNTISVPILEKNLIPSEFVDNATIIYGKSFCTERMEILSKGIDQKSLKIPYCKLNSMLTPFDMAPGIKELGELFKDQYDESTGTYVMSSYSAKQYKDVIDQFYKVMYGENLPDNMSLTFETLKEPEYDMNHGCYETYMDIDGKIFSEFKENIMLMKKNIQSDSAKIFAILPEIFDLSVKPVSLNKSLSRENIQPIITRTRELIAKMYYNCENYFQQGLQLFRNIVYQSLIESSNKNIKDLMEMKNQDSYF